MHKDLFKVRIFHFFMFEYDVSCVQSLAFSNWDTEYPCSDVRVRLVTEFLKNSFFPASCESYTRKLCPFCISHVLQSLLKLSNPPYTVCTTETILLELAAVFSERICTNLTNEVVKAKSSFKIIRSASVWSVFWRILPSNLLQKLASIEYNDS